MLTIKKLIAFTAILVMFVGFASDAQAQNNGKSMKMDYGFAFTPCNGEPLPWGGVAEFINATGTYNLVVIREETDENGCYKIKLHVNTQNVRGVGAVTGNEYRIIEVGNQQIIDEILCDGCILRFTAASMYQVKTKNGSSYLSRGSYDIIINLCTWEFVEIRANFGGGCN